LKAVRLFVSVVVIATEGAEKIAASSSYAFSFIVIRQVSLYSALLIKPNAGETTVHVRTELDAKLC
jgi:hypothetical protein